MRYQQRLLNVKYRGKRKRSNNCPFEIHQNSFSTIAVRNQFNTNAMCIDCRTMEDLT